ncbi:CC103 protein, partial [Atractosteus spatula]|nr:CC103 protein [Atractosteus spatula]
MEQSDGIDFAALERELQAALEADRRYRTENDAKFRAVRQQVGSYEEFRDIVLASHLKPLERKDKAGAPRKQPWNSLASGSGQKDLPDYGRIEVSVGTEIVIGNGSSIFIACHHSILQYKYSFEYPKRLIEMYYFAVKSSESMQLNLTRNDQTQDLSLLKGLERVLARGRGGWDPLQSEEEGCRQLFEKLLAAAETAGAMDDKTLLRSTQDNGTEKVKNIVKELRDLMQLYKLSADSSP